MYGYVPQNGNGSNGVLVILEAAGADEEIAGIPTVGSAGQYLWNELHRNGIEREGFRIHNVLSCRPPGNHLAKAPYEYEAIQHCAPLLDATITEHVEHAKAVGRTPIIIALGKIAFKRLMGVHDCDLIMKKDYIAYPFWSEKYSAWILAAYHPSHLMQGKQALTPILVYVFQRALEIAEHGITIDNLEGAYIEDPLPETFESWVRDYFWHLERDSETVLSYDIETPYKQGKGEDEVTTDDDTTAILRCSFSYKPGTAVSVPWKAGYFPVLAKLFASNGSKVGWNNSVFDAPKIREYFPINGDEIDGMLAWHVLNSSFLKRLGFVTPFYAQKMSMWKHLDKERPAYYNCCDADAALRCWLGIKQDLVKNKLWDVFQNHVIRVHRVYAYMSQQGLLLDQQLRRESELKLATMLEDIEQAMEASVPLAARRLKVYKKTPAAIAAIEKEWGNYDKQLLMERRYRQEIAKTGMIQIIGTTKITQCPRCQITDIKAAHFKPVGKKRLKAGAEENPCIGLKSRKIPIKTLLWAQPLGFKVSKLGLTNYQGAVKHRAIFDKRKGKTTYDESAMMRLMKKYPSDKLYPLILEHREKQKLLSVYIGITQPNGLIRGGMPIGPDGKIHSTLTSNPNTLRSASQGPNLQNLTRPGIDPATGKVDLNALASIVRNLIVASPGNLLYARDFCVAPRTKILKTDLTWAEARDIHIGDELIGFDEDFSSAMGVGKGHRRKGKFKPALVTAVKKVKLPLVRVYTTKGMTTVATTHKFVARYRSYNRKWVAAADLQPGMLMPFLSSPWETEISRDAGWIAGILDGEGWCSGVVGYAQNPGIVLDRMHQLLEERAYTFRESPSNSTSQVEVIGGSGEQLRLLGSIRPIRLLEKSRSIWEGRTISGKSTPPASVIAVIPLKEGESDAIAITTTAGTYISDGFFSHNCGIEAVLVGYDAAAPQYIRLARRDVHTYYCAWALSELEPGRIPSNNLPLLSWDDTKLFQHLAELKASLRRERNSLYKHLVHAANYAQTPSGAQKKIFAETGVEFDTAQVARVMEIYFELFPEIRQWHHRVLAQAAKDGYIRNAYNYLMRFSHVYDWEKVNDKWVSTPNHDVANKVIASGPQSNAAGIIKEALLQLYELHFEEAGQYLRLLVHDEILSDVPVSQLSRVDSLSQTVMEAPLKAFPLPASYNMGDYLSILTEAKQGPSWARMK